MVQNKLYRLRTVFDVINIILIVLELSIIVFSIFTANASFTGIIPVIMYICVIMIVLLCVCKAFLFFYREKMIKHNGLINDAKNYRGNRYINRISWVIMVMVLFVFCFWFFIGEHLSILSSSPENSFYFYYEERLNYYVTGVIMILGAIALLGVAMIIAGKKSKKMIVLTSVLVLLFFVSVGWEFLGTKIMIDERNSKGVCKTIKDNHNLIPENGHKDCPADKPVLITTCSLSVLLFSFIVVGSVVATKEYSKT